MPTQNTSKPTSTCKKRAYSANRVFFVGFHIYTNMHVSGGFQFVAVIKIVWIFVISLNDWRDSLEMRLKKGMAMTSQKASS